LAEKRYQVFLSSTYKDLINERDRMLRELARFNYIAAGMEYFPAIDEEQYEYIKAIIDDSDFYVIVVAGRYGTLAPDGLSYCEKEYNYALERGLPVISLLHSDVDSLPASKQEKTPEVRSQLDAFRRRLADRRLAAFWKDETELCLALVGSLAATAKRHPRLGWVRGSERSVEDLLRRIVDLEEENTSLKSTIDRPLIDHVRRLLAAGFRLYYFVQTSESDPAPTEASKDVSWQETAGYILPRIDKLTSADKFEQIVIEFVQSVSEDKVASVAKSTISQVRATFRRFGLIGDYKTLDGRDVILTSNLGAEFAQEEIKNYENERRRKEGFAVVMEDWSLQFHRWIAKRLGI
jgi:hypothetical protein